MYIQKGLQLYDLLWKEVCTRIWFDVNSQKISKIGCIPLMIKFRII